MDIFIAFLIQLAISIALIELTARRPKSNLKAKGLDDFTFPTADASRAIPYFAGDVMLEAPNVTWYGDFAAITLKDRVKVSFFQSKKVDVGVQYYVGMELSLSYGVVDSIKEIWFADKQAWTGTLTHGQVAFVNSPTLFGGRAKGGGVSASVIFYSGTSTQSADPYMTGQQGKSYNQKGVARLIWKGPSVIASTGAGIVGGGVVDTLTAKILQVSGGAASGMIGESEQIQPIRIRAFRFPNNLSLGSNRHIINNTANPAEVIYELVTGRYAPFAGDKTTPHLQDSDIDIASLQALGVTCFNEGLGVSFQWQRDGNVGDIIDDILDQITGIKRENPYTGLIEFKLLRNDYTVGSLPVLDDTKISKLTNLTRNAISATANKVVATYTDKLDQFKEKTVTVQSNASMWMQSNEASVNMDLSYLSDVAVVNARAQARLNQMSFPAYSGEITTDRRSWGMLAGDLFVLNWAPDGISGVVCRALSVNLGGIADNVVSISFVQDVFSAGTAVFSSPPSSGWVDPLSNAINVITYKVEEVPYKVMAGENPYRLMAWAAPPTSDSFSVNVNVSVSGGTYINDYPDEAFSCPIPLLQDWSRTAGYDTSQTLHLNLTGVLDQLIKNVPLADIENNFTNVINLNGEWIAIVDWTDLGSGDFRINSVYRGFLDTVPVAHTAGEIGYTLADMLDIRSTQFAMSGAWGLKLQTITSRNTLAIGSTTAITGTIAGRQDRPYPPRGVTLNGSYSPTYIAASPISLAWGHSDRTVAVTSSGVTSTPEAGVTYTLRLYGESNNLLRTETGLTGTTYTWSAEETDSGLIIPGAGGVTYSEDTFAVDTTGSYTQYADSAGTWSIASGELSAINGTQSKFIRNGTSYTDVQIECDINQAQDGGLVLRFINNSNYYLLLLCDDSGTTPAENLRMYKRVGGTYTQLGALNITWARGTNKTVRFAVSGTTLTASVDGSVLTRTDSSIAGPGGVGMRHQSSTASKYQAFRWDIQGAPVDPYSSNVVALLHCNGADGSTTFTDQRGHVFTAFGNAQIDTAQSRFGGSSGLFDGNGDYLTAPGTSDFNLTSGDWAIEAWIYIAALSSGNMQIVNKDGTAGLYYSQYAMGVNSAGKLHVFIGSGGTSSASQTITGVTTVTTGAWHHVAATLSGTTLRLFLDGVQEGSLTKTIAMGDGGRPLYIGWENGQPAATFFNGWKDEIRITKGQARYTANFAPPTAPFPDGFYRLNNQIRCELESVRGGVASYQKYDASAIRVGYGYSYGVRYGGL